MEGNFQILGILWEFAPFPEKYNPIKLESYDGKEPPSQYIYYFLSQTCHLLGNDSTMTKMFVYPVRASIHVVYIVAFGD